ncbi:MAG: NACHT domain-containing protein [Brasilonema octagenarum HA4186-MV1]|jgi:predicted NACHT family NTPase|nr:NACHT domain-containing protein [Brasilonema octagenarum HA4186-MV1]
MSTIFIQLFLKAIESILGKSVEPLSEPIKEGISRFIGKDQESKRRDAFANAVKITRAKTIEKFVGDRKQAEKVLNLLDDENHQDVPVKVAEEAAKLFLLSDKPDIPSLTNLCNNELVLKARLSGEPVPTKDIVRDVLSAFLDNLQLALLDQEAYKDFIPKTLLSQVTGIREIIEEHFRVTRQYYDDEVKYRNQLAKAHRTLKFSGFPDLKEQSIPIEIKDIFVRLRAKQEVEATKVIRDTLNEAEKSKLETCQTTAESPGSQKQKEVMLDEALKEIECAVILGDPGAGKTTLLEQWTVICAEKQAEMQLGIKTADGMPLLPIFVRLRYFAAEAAKRSQDYNLIDYFYTRTHELQLSLSNRFFQEALEAKRCLVCLDGLDEVAADRIKVRDAVEALVTRYPGNRYIVTSRIVGYEEAPLNRRDFVHHKLLELTIDDIREFVKKWYKLREPDLQERKKQIDHLITTIEREERIEKLASNPLLLTIIALV